MNHLPPSAPDIITAFGSLGIFAGDDLKFVTDIRRDGAGFSVELDLPYGVTAAMIAERQDDLVAALGRPVLTAGVPGEHPGRLRVNFPCGEVTP